MTEIINQIFGLETKLNKDNIKSGQRYFDRISAEFEQMGYQIVNPIGKAYRNEMTDVEASIAGNLDKNPTITKVLKPIVYRIENDQAQLVQKGIVIVE